ncbi:hypothetical protein [Emticicia sp. SJ17W-69]|uniref:hypothetical protein n=1 Tax=Emticicia sp. SJ17W-69 TaxID=3421657 RepID=UPI003EB6BB57
MIELESVPNLFQLLDLENYKFLLERIIVFEIVAFDWNCHQYITSSYTLPEMEEFLTSQKVYIAK